MTIGGSTGNTALNYLIIKSLQKPDTDGDGLSDSDETLLKTDSIRPDTDSDGLSDSEEIVQGSDPLKLGSPIAGNWIRVNFQPSTTPVPSGYRQDNGARYDKVRGYGWTTALPNRVRNVNPDPRLDTFVFVSPNQSPTWQYTLPNGKYLISLASGDPRWAQGPLRVVIEGITAVDNSRTSRDTYLIVNDFPVTVSDGNLSLSLGGTNGHSLLNYIIVKPVQ